MGEGWLYMRACTLLVPSPFLYYSLSLSLHTLVVVLVFWGGGVAFVVVIDLLSSSSSSSFPSSPPLLPSSGAVAPRPFRVFLLPLSFIFLAVVFPFSSLFSFLVFFLRLLILL